MIQFQTFSVAARTAIGLLRRRKRGNGDRICNARFAARRPQPSGHLAQSRSQRSTTSSQRFFH